MALTELTNFTGFTEEMLVGGVLGGLFVTSVFIAILLVLAFYVYQAITWQRIGRNQKYKYPWLAWIPFANVSMVLEMGGFHWAWIFLILIPILGWIALFVLWIISLWRIFEKSNYPGWLGLAQIIPKIGSILYLIIIGLVAWKKK